MLKVDKQEGRKLTKRLILWIFGLKSYILLSSKRCFSMQFSPLSTLESSFEVLNVKKFDGDLKSLFISVTCLA